MRYILWFSIELGHSYYGNNQVPASAIQIIPQAHTRKLLKQLRLLLKTQAAKLNVLIPVADDGITPLFPPDSNVQLDFSLSLVEPALAIVTDLTPVSLDETISGSRFLRFDNGSMPGSQTTLSRSTFEPLHTEVFSSITPASDETFFLKKSPLEGLIVSDLAISGITGVGNPTTYSEDEKMIRINTSSLSAGDKFSLSYRSPLPDKGVVAQINIVNTASLVNAPAYSIDLDVNSEVWSYYVIIPDSENTSNVSIEDTFSTRPGGGISFNESLLPATGNTNARDQKIVDAHPGNSVVRIDSTVPLPYRQESYKQIRLLYQATGAISPIEFDPLQTPSVFDNNTLIYNLST